MKLFKNIALLSIGLGFSLAAFANPATFTLVNKTSCAVDAMNNPLPKPALTLPVYVFSGKNGHYYGGAEIDFNQSKSGISLDMVDGTWNNNQPAMGFIIGPTKNPFLMRSVNIFTGYTQSTYYIVRLIDPKIKDCENNAGTVCVAILPNDPCAFNK